MKIIINKDRKISKKSKEKKGILKIYVEIYKWNIRLKL